MTQERLIEGLVEIARYLGLDKPTGDGTRHVLVGWVAFEGCPIAHLNGRYYARPSELDRWWAEHVDRLGRRRNVRRRPKTAANGH